VIRKAIVLAAGRGTRLGALTASLPKPLMEIAGCPVIGHVIGGLASAGVRDVLVVTGHLADVLEARLGDGAQYGGAPCVRYARQERPDGTARALATGRAFVGDEPFVYAWGDVLVERGSYARVVETTTDGATVIAVNEVDDPYAGAAVYFDEALRVSRIVEKPPKGSSTTRWNNAGIGVLRASIWPRIDALAPSTRGEHELPQAIAALVEAGEVVRAVPLEGAWFDLGTPEDLQMARSAWSKT